jgi:hypothetical protein
MSLQTDIIFVRALRENQELMAQLPAGDVYNTAIALPEPEAENAPLPYIIVSYDGMTNDQTTKDSFEGDTDTVTIGIEVAATTRKELFDITQAVRTTVLAFFEQLPEDDTDIAEAPLDYQLSATAVNYDDLKPCYWQRLSYQCDVQALNV